MLNVGVIGCGRIAEHHFRFIERTEGARVAALCDPVVANAQRFAEQYNIREVYSSYTEMLESVPLDVVHILTPPEFHYAQALDAIERGVHVLIEKPCTTHAEELVDLYRRADANGVILCPDFIQLFHPSFIEAATLIDSDELGNVIHVEVHLSLNLKPPDLRETMGIPWRYCLPGGILHDNLTHLLYLPLRWLGQPKKVSVATQCYNTLPQGLTDHMNILVEGERCTADITISGAIKPESYYLKVFCERGNVLINFDTSTNLITRNGVLPRALRRATSNFDQAYQLFASGLSNGIKFARGKIIPYQGLQNLITGFYDCIRRGGPLPVSKKLAISVAQTEEKVFAQAGKLHIHTRTQPSRQKSIRRLERVLLTGATGYLGSAVVQKLVKEGYYVRALVRELSYTEILENLGVELIYGDIRNPKALIEASNSMDIVVHVAAALQGSPQFMLDCAIKGTQNVSEAAKACDLKRVIYMSSMSVYDCLGLHEGELFSEGSALEEFPHLRGTYSLAKRRAEDIALSHLCDTRPGWTILRPSVIVGKVGDILSPLGKKFGNLLICSGSSEKVLRLIHVDDVAAAIENLIRNDATQGQIFNLSDNGVTQRQYINEVIRKSGYENIRVIYIPYWLARLATVGLGSLRLLSRRIPQVNKRRLASLYRNVRANSAALTATTGWQPRKDLLEALAAEARSLKTAASAPPNPTKVVTSSRKDAGTYAEIG